MSEAGLSFWKKHVVLLSGLEETKKGNKMRIRQSWMCSKKEIDKTESDRSRGTDNTNSCSETIQGRSCGSRSRKGVVSFFFRKGVVSLSSGKVYPCLQERCCILVFRKGVVSLSSGKVLYPCLQERCCILVFRKGVVSFFRKGVVSFFRKGVVSFFFFCIPQQYRWGSPFFFFFFFCCVPSYISGVHHSSSSSSAVFPAISLGFTILLLLLRSHISLGFIILLLLRSQLHISLGFTILLLRSQLYLWGSPFFFFSCISSYIFGVHHSSSSSAFPAIHLGFTILLRSPAVSLWFTILLLCSQLYLGGSPFFFYCVPSYISGVHHFGWNFCACDRF